jgi:RNA methyltransferase, TrmH family
VITSVNNRKVVDAVRLKKRSFRDRSARFLVEGVQAVGEALRSAGLEVLFHTDPSHDLVRRAADAGIPVHEVDPAVMVRLTSTVTPQGLVGVAGFLDRSLNEVAQDASCVAILHSVRDPGNAGTVLRSADAAGLDAVIFSESSVDVYNPKAVRASAGSLFHIPVTRDVGTSEAIDALRERGYAVLAASTSGESDLYEVDLTRPTAFLFGNEAWGLPDDVAALADTTVRIPLAGGTESLNLAAAATVCLFEWARQRREGRRVALESVIAAAAHDIRSPLTAMKGFAFALQRRYESMTDEQRDLMFRGIVHDTDRMDQVVRLLVDAARIVGGTLDLFPERTDVGKLVSDLAESLSRDPEHPPVVWTDGELEVLVDPDRLRSVLLAFVEAQVWWAREGAVEVDGRATDGRLSLTVSRAGTELSQTDAEELFLPRRPGAGSGSKIGLFVARGIAQALGGTATAHVEGERLSFGLDVMATT